MTEHPQTPPQQGAPHPPQPLSPTEERNLGLIAHLVPAVLLPLSAGTLGFLGSLVIYLCTRTAGPSSASTRPTASTCRSSPRSCCWPRPC